MKFYSIKIELGAYKDETLRLTKLLQEHMSKYTSLSLITPSKTTNKILDLECENAKLKDVVCTLTEDNMKLLRD